MKPLTVRQAEIYKFIRSFIKSNKRGPSRGEIAKHFGFRPNGAQDHVLALAKKGAVRLLPDTAHGIELVKGYRVNIIKEIK